MTYKKPIKRFEAQTLTGEYVFAQDTATERLGSYAIEAFEGKKTIKGLSGDGNKETLVPFHAVKTAIYVTMTDVAEKPDPCDGGVLTMGN